MNDNEKPAVRLAMDAAKAPAEEPAAAQEGAAHDA